MEENNVQVNYYDLPKPDRKALEREFEATVEGKKARRLVIILVCLYAAVMIAMLIISFSERDGSNTLFTTVD